MCCVISYFYIKPQPKRRHDREKRRCVISYFYIKPQPIVNALNMKSVVLYLTSTSNHNTLDNWALIVVLCYILLLHQTTTLQALVLLLERLCYILLLHQTTTRPSLVFNSIGCVISYFYIKPQLLNFGGFCENRCVISYFYIKPQHNHECAIVKRCCVISYFYIKPQQESVSTFDEIVVLYLTSTSNHNKTARVSAE